MRSSRRGRAFLFAQNYVRLIRRFRPTPANRGWKILAQNPDPRILPARLNWGYSSVGRALRSQ